MRGGAGYNVNAARVTKTQIQCTCLNAFIDCEAGPADRRVASTLSQIERRALQHTHPKDGMLQLDMPMALTRQSVVEAIQQLNPLLGWQPDRDSNIQI